MSRSTKFIGLTDKATLFVKDFKMLPSTQDAEGLDGERFPLRRWVGNDGLIEYWEVVQAAPWSSGPMIFTHLAMYYPVNMADGEFILSWVLDPTLTKRQSYTEYDQREGTYWV